MANDEQLRRGLQERFRQHEVEPAPGLEKTILSKVAPSSPWWQTIAGKVAIVTGGMLVGGAVWLLSLRDQPLRQQSVESNVQSPPIRRKTVSPAPALPSGLSAPASSEAAGGASIADSVQGPNAKLGKWPTDETKVESRYTDSHLGKRPSVPEPDSTHLMAGVVDRSSFRPETAPTPKANKRIDVAGKPANPLRESAGVHRLNSPKASAGISGNSSPGHRRNRTTLAPEQPRRSSTVQTLARRESATVARALSNPATVSPLVLSAAHAPVVGQSAVGAQPARQTMFISRLAIKPYQLPLSRAQLPRLVFTPLGAQPTRQIRQPLSFAVGVVTGPQLVYGEEQSARPGWSAGVWGAVRLSARLSLETGVGLSRPSVVSRPDSGLVSIDSLTRRELTRQTQAWWNLSIPLLIRYQIRTGQRWRWSVAAGLSSAAVIGSVRTSDYSVRKGRTPADTSGQLSVTHEQVVERGRSAVLWQPFRWLHVSTTVEFAHVGRHRLLLEPYVSYPIGGVTAQSLRLSMAGLQLRLQLRPSPRLR